jgi:hypothetical protein
MAAGANGGGGGICPAAGKARPPRTSAAASGMRYIFGDGKDAAMVMATLLKAIDPVSVFSRERRPLALRALFLDNAEGQ